MSNELSAVPPDETPQNPLALLAKMDMATVDPDKIGKLLDIQERWENRQAEKALASALANFQKNSPVINKGRKTNNSDYASLDDILIAIRGPLADNGLSVSFDTKTEEKSLTATCYILHNGGATFSRQVTVPIDTAMRGANASQQAGSATTYAKRYALVAALNLIVSDRDDDGAAAGTAYLNEHEVSEVSALLDKFGKDRNKTLTGMLDWLKLESIDQIPAARFKDVMGKLRTKLQTYQGQ